MFHQDWGPSGAPTPIILNINRPMPFGMTPMVDSLHGWDLSLLILLVPRENDPYAHSLKSPSRMCMQRWFCGFDKRTMSSRSKDLHEIDTSTDFKWSMQDLGYLVSITNFEFLCRKLNFGHVGIVQNFIFFIKSARRFRKTISTLASQRVACIPGIPRPTIVYFWIWEPWMMWREMHGWQTWSVR